MSNDLREAVARAICAKTGDNPNNLTTVDGEDVPLWQCYLPEAEAAIRIVVEACAREAEQDFYRTADEIAAAIRKLGAQP